MVDHLTEGRSDSDAPLPLPPLATIPSELRCLTDYERRAEAHMHPDVWRHIQGGAGPELSLVRNRQQFDHYSLLPRALADMRGATTEITLFGLRHAAPILLAPVAYHRLAHPEGEIAAVTAATALDTTMITSTLSSYTLEEIAARASTVSAELVRTMPPLWFQLYFQPDRAHSAELVRRAEEAGYQVLVCTVDASVKHTGLTLPADVDAANLRGLPRLSQTSTAAEGRIVFGTPLLDAAPTWETLAWLRSITKLPIVVKGLLSPDDARLAMDHGADGIIVSNHGGRVIDGLVSPLQALPLIAEMVDGKVPLLLDSGVRHGTDILKALALGAQAVLIGRPQLHALAVGGMQGVAHMLQILRAELELAMVAVGRVSPKLITPDALIAAR